MKDLNNDISKHISYHIDCIVFIEFNFIIKIFNLKIFPIAESENILKY